MFARIFGKKVFKGVEVGVREVREDDARMDALLATLHDRYEKMISNPISLLAGRFLLEDYSIPTASETFCKRAAKLRKAAKQRGFRFIDSFPAICFHFAQKPHTIPIVATLTANYPSIAGLCEFCSKTLYVDWSMAPGKRSMTLIHEFTHLLCQDLGTAPNLQLMEAVAYLTTCLVADAFQVKGLEGPTLYGVLHYEVPLDVLQEAMRIAKQKAKEIVELMG